MTCYAERTFDAVCSLLEKGFGACAAKVNELHGDGIKLPEKYVAGSGNEQKLFPPCIIVSYRETEYMQKDRIIELCVYTVGISFDIGKKISMRQRFRIEEALALFAEENRRCNLWQSLKVEKASESGCILRIEV